MKRIAFIIMLLVASAQLFAQKIGRITLSSSEKSDIITYEADKTLLINFSKDGKILNWGTEDHWGKLLDYMGRVDYYTATDDSAFIGKVKYIGQFQITYYASYDEEILRGKIKSIGYNNFDYYMSFEDESVKGKIKNIGATPFSYYSSVDNEAYKGKIRTVGSTNISYYAAFDDKAYKGKVKSIGNINFSYYSSFDRREYQGSMKPGTTYNPYVNGIKFFVRN
jgi:hypothetical protein